MKKSSLLAVASIVTITTIFFHFILTRPDDSLLTVETNKKLTIWVEDPNSQRDSYFTHMVERFSMGHPDLDIELHFIPGSTEKSYHYITTEILNRNSPDILLSSLENYNKLACNHQLLSLNDYLKDFDQDHFLASATAYSMYEGNSYGLAYHLDPEVLVYRKDFLSSLSFSPPYNFESLGGFYDYLSPLHDIYSKDQLNKIPFSIPTLIAGSDFYSSFLNNRLLVENAGDIASLSPQSLAQPLGVIESMYKHYEQIPYHANKISAHPFLNGRSALALEPLSLIYNDISKDKNLLRKIGIVPIKDSPLKFSYSNSRYISLLNRAEILDESFLFLDFFFSEKEVWARYRDMNLPIVLTSLKKDFIVNKRFHNENIIDYVEEAFHHRISLETPAFLKSLDDLYEETLHH